MTEAKGFYRNPKQENYSNIHNRGEGSPYSGKQYWWNASGVSIHLCRSINFLHWNGNYVWIGHFRKVDINKTVMIVVDETPHDTLGGINVYCQRHDHAQNTKFIQRSDNTMFQLPDRKMSVPVHYIGC